MCGTATGTNFCRGNDTVPGIEEKTMDKFLKSNKTKYRLARTIVQGVIGVIFAYIDVLVGYVAIPDELRPMIVALVMAVLSPIMSELGKNNDEEGDEA